MLGPHLIQYFAGDHTPTILGYKFKPTNQMLFFLIKDPDGLTDHELHIHYSNDKNGVFTTANLRWKADKAGHPNSIAVAKESPIVCKCLAVFTPVDFLKEVAVGAHV
ncbi:MAG: hypothetical protein KC457_05175 [Myxococcales bacterium]|nr:hypothetical protein [Myxococcales bacterium]